MLTRHNNPIQGAKKKPRNSNIKTTPTTKCTNPSQKKKKPKNKKVATNLQKTENPKTNTLR
jgi:hypothetical protein